MAAAAFSAALPADHQPGQRVLHHAFSRMEGPGSWRCIPGRDRISPGQRWPHGGRLPKSSPPRPSAAWKRPRCRSPGASRPCASSTAISRCRLVYQHIPNCGGRPAPAVGGLYLEVVEAADDAGDAETLQVPSGRCSPNGVEFKNQLDHRGLHGVWDKDKALVLFPTSFCRTHTAAGSPHTSPL